MKANLKITKRDWIAICAFVEIGIMDTIEQEMPGYKSPYRKHLRTWLSLRKRIWKQQINQKARK